MSAAPLIDRLASVRRLGAGRWLGRCPAHDDKRASLSLRELEDGRVLVHCFAGCTVEEVLTAVRLGFDALFPERPLTRTSAPLRAPFPAADVLQAIAFEATVVFLSAKTLERGEALSDSDRQRLLTAAARLQRAIEVAGHA